MPKGDRTGPASQGTMTGRRMGYCAGFNMPGFANSCFGRGLGWRNGMMPVQPQVITEQQEKEILEQEIELIKQEMDEIQKRLKELK